MQDLNRFSLLSPLKIKSKPTDGDGAMVSAAMLGTSLYKEDSPGVWHVPVLLPSLSRLRRTLAWRRLHLFFFFFFFLSLLAALMGGRMDALALRTRPQESLPDVSDWEARPMRGRGCGDAGRGGRGCSRSNFIQKNAASLSPLPLRFTPALISCK